jgi:transcriptional regulator with XRE-family HTH domain
MLKGYKIKEYISKNRITQAEFALKVGVSTPTISKLINKNTCDLDTLLLVADEMKVSLDYLFDRDSIGNNKQSEIFLHKQEEIPNINSHIFLAIPIDNDEFLDLREMKDKVIRILSK